MMASSNGNIFRVTGICAGNSPVPGEFPTQRPVTRSFDVFSDLRPNKRFSKNWWGWWFETPSHPLWRHCNAVLYTSYANGFFLYIAVLPAKFQHCWTARLSVMDDRNVARFMAYLLSSDIPNTHNKMSILLGVENMWLLSKFKTT